MNYKNKLHLKELKRENARGAAKGGINLSDVRIYPHQKILSDQFPPPSSFLLQPVNFLFFLQLIMCLYKLMF